MLRILTTTILMALTASAARAQSRESRLDDAGEWFATRQPVEGSDEWVVARARQDLADDRPAAAHAAIDNWIRANDRRLGAASPLMADALLARADALTAMGDEYNALYDYERVIKEFPGSDTYVMAVERELDIGVRYLGGLRRKFLGVRILDARAEGEELLIRVQERLPGSRLAERAGIELADYYYNSHELSLASEAYDLFLDNYRNSQYSMKAMQRRVYSTIAQFKGPRYDGSKLLDAQVLVNRFASLYPAQARKVGLDEALLARLDESAGLSMLESARWYLKRGDTPAARYTLRRLIEEHPQTSAAREAMAIMDSRGWKMTDPPPVRQAESRGTEASADSATGAQGRAPAGSAGPREVAP